MSEDEWISPNGIWKIHKPEFRDGGWFIENLRTGFGDSPTLFRTMGMVAFDVAFDYPEIVPKYVKTQFREMAGCVP